MKLLIFGLLLYAGIFISWHFLDLGAIAVNNCIALGVQYPYEGCNLGNGFWSANANQVFHLAMYGMVTSGALLGRGYFWMLYKNGMNGVSSG